MGRHRGQLFSYRNKFEKGSGCSCYYSSSYAEQPIDVLQELIDQGTHILKDPIYKVAGQKELQRQKLSEVVNQNVDYKEFCRRALANNWLKFKPQQIDEFTNLFSKFVTVFYLTLLQEKYNNEKVILIGQNLISDSIAVVRVNVLWKNLEVPVEIKMIRRVDSWKAYDIIILGISAVRFYGNQFQAVLRKETPAQIIDRLKIKIRTIEEPLQTSFSKKSQMNSVIFWKQFS
ncbi:MAG: ABC transporter substrate-binding protein [Deltaproteobacteria bacterium]|nr:ABC transporter substrate-binding protein [Deltaproteobacteria bacterium]MBW2319920.1 ABC transporter substrate-binding protein [Deltaproteobacteria bacterium]